MSLDYGQRNAQIILLANIETLNTIEDQFSNIKGFKPLEFRIGILQIPIFADEPLARYVEPQTKPIEISKIKEKLKLSSDDRLVDSDDLLFDFSDMSLDEL